MPSRQQHLKESAFVGGLVGLAYSTVRQLAEMRRGVRQRFDIGEAAQYTGLGVVFGAAGGLLPDGLEPAYCPHHRQFFHSYAMGAGVCYGIRKVVDADVPDELKLITLCTGAGYLTHLASDSATPFGLPLL